MVTRRGFSLVEVIVAMVLLSIALLGIAGTALLAARMLSAGEIREQASRRAASVLDSLVLLHGNATGTRSYPGYRLTWSADSARVAVRVAFPDDTGIELQATP